MSRFTECLDFVLKREGGYVDHPNDRGGATNKGITQAVYDAYRSSNAWPLQPVKYILQDEIESIYRSRYWSLCMCDRMPPRLDLVLFDSAVNHGVKQASKFLQRAVGVDDDGSIGKITLTAVDVDIKAGMMDDLLKNIISQRSDFYDKLVQKDSSQAVFRKGWANRLNELSKAVSV